jgi:hypothetical protein
MSDRQYSNKQQKSPGRAIVYILIIILGMFLISMVIVFSKTDPQEIYKKNANLRVEVLNGCGVDRLALKVTNFLRKKGFNVVKIGDTQNQAFDETVVLERGQDNMTNAKYFAKQIGCKNIDKDIDQALYVDITVIIGKDYKKIFTDVEKEF